MVVLPQAGPSADASQAMLSNIQVPHGPHSALHRNYQHLPHTAFFELRPGNPCGTFIESPTGSSGDGYAAVPDVRHGRSGKYLHPSRPVAQTLRCAFKRS